MIPEVPGPLLCGINSNGGGCGSRNNSHNIRSRSGSGGGGSGLPHPYPHSRCPVPGGGRRGRRQRRQRRRLDETGHLQVGRCVARRRAGAAGLRRRRRRASRGPCSGRRRSIATSAPAEAVGGIAAACGPRGSGCGAVPPPPLARRRSGACCEDRRPRPGLHRHRSGEAARARRCSSGSNDPPGALRPSQGPGELSRPRGLRARPSVCNVFSALGAAHPRPAGSSRFCIPLYVVGGWRFRALSPNRAFGAGVSLLRPRFYELPLLLLSLRAAFLFARKEDPRREVW